MDIGGTGFKASVLDADGAMVADRVKIPTPYPLPPDKLVGLLKRLIAPLPTAERASAGFPGMVRDGVVPVRARTSSPSPARARRRPPAGDVCGTGSTWPRALTREFGIPTKAANDADIQGAAVVTGKGLELVITLGTGFGTGPLLQRASSCPTWRSPTSRSARARTYDDQLGEATRKEIGEERWNKRVAKAIANMRALTFFDHLYIGGGNSRRVLATPPA